MLVLGVTAAPRYMDQRRRARISFRKRRMLAATGSGGVPASTRSNCWRARLSSFL